MYRIITALLIMLVATAAFADKPIVDSKDYVLTRMDAVDSPSGRDVYVLSYSYTDGPIDYDYASVVYGDQGILPADAVIVGFGTEGIYADIYENPGASFSNWASECFIGYSYFDGLVVSYVGITPFDENAGPGTFGPAADFYIVGADMAAIDPGFVVPPPADPFTFYASAQYDDGTGMYAGTVTAGTIFVEIDTQVVSAESMTLGGLKALYR